MPGMDVTCRTMTAADVDAVAELHVRAWQSAYRGLMPADFLDGMSPAEQARRRRERGVEAGELVAEAGGRVVGWAAVGPYRHDDAPAPDCGELHAIYLRPELIGRGVGRELMAYAQGELRRRGLLPALLWVVAANERARRFYDRAGWYADGATHDYEIAGATLPEARYRWDG